MPRDVEEEVQVRRPCARLLCGSSPVAEGGTPAQALVHNNRMEEGRMSYRQHTVMRVKGAER